MSQRPASIDSTRPSRLRRIARIGATAAFAAAITVAVVPVASAAGSTGTSSGLYYQPAYASSSTDGAVSGDWAGYDLTGSTYTSVGASWTEPTVTCAVGESSYSADWVGLDGDGSESVEQIGASADCDAGTPTYSAWYEFYPASSVTLPQTVKAGDKMSATVKAAADSTYTLTLVDHTAGWTKTVTGSAPDAQNASAEIIAEAPSASSRQGSVLPLADFKSVAFTDVSVDGKALTAASGARKIDMGSETGAAMATTSAVSDAGFSVTWAGSGADAVSTGRGSRGVTPGSGLTPGSTGDSTGTGDGTGSGSDGYGGYPASGTSGASLAWVLTPRGWVLVEISGDSSDTTGSNSTGGDSTGSDTTGSNATGSDSTGSDTAGASGSNGWSQWAADGGWAEIDASSAGVGA